MEKIIIKKATEKHLKDINKLSATVFQLHDQLLPYFFADRNSDESMKHYCELINKNNTILLVAIKDRSVVGYLLALILYKPWQKTPLICSLDEIGVLESYQHKGIGNALFTTLKKECKKRKIRNITLNVYVKNKKATNFYKKMGCHTISQRMDIEVK